MLAYRYPVIAREGWLWILLAIIVAGITYVNKGVASAPFWVLVVFLVFLFRDPHRKIPALPLGVVCPVDGKIVTVEKVFDAYLGRPAICISIKMGFFSVYSVHNPMEGKINKQWLEFPRQIQSLTTDKNNKTATNAESSANTNTGPTAFAQWIESDEGDDVVLVMEANTFLPRPRCYAQGGERIGQGQRCGFLQFGTQVDVLVPESTRVDLQVGDKVLAGTDIIATLVRAEDGLPTREIVANA